jgi:hypothetical protein
LNIWNTALILVGEGACQEMGKHWGIEPDKVGAGIRQVMACLLYALGHEPDREPAPPLVDAVAHIEALGGLSAAIQISPLRTGSASAQKEAPPAAGELHGIAPAVLSHLFGDKTDVLPHAMASQLGIEHEAALALVHQGTLVLIAYLACRMAYEEETLAQTMSTIRAEREMVAPYLPIQLQTAWSGQSTVSVKEEKPRTLTRTHLRWALLIAGIVLALCAMRYHYGPFELPQPDTVATPVAQ